MIAIWSDKYLRLLEDVCFYFGWLRHGQSIVLHLPERVLRQYGYTQTIPRLPTQPADPLATRERISAQFAEYLDRVLTPEQRGVAAISHPYMMPLPPGDRPRPCELEAIVQEEGPLASSLTDTNNRIIFVLEGSRARRDVHAICDAGNYARQYRRRGGRHATQ
ncbi:hypothetical protein TSUD_279760 [Trifolium subterraneum]|uniref:Aminotransferase-like plant mobile domain-containing protein n=1 Tax=Trifolium subterraneum TaxID=3900 RepID=A0A2Z6MM15_TRISU|nr:hypothetical protein TSUD_279760 [Trifolium subterraneum]